MLIDRRFEIRFDQDAYKEYEKLDNSVAELVDKALEELEFRANEVGTHLKNQRSSQLRGCKEIKLRGAGIRIIFQVTKKIVDVLLIVYVLAINKRNNDVVFQIADNRFRMLKANPGRQLTHGRPWDRMHHIGRKPKGRKSKAEPPK